MAWVTVIVVSYNSRSHLSACLTSVGEQQGVPVEIAVVDNASADGSASLVAAEFPAVRLIVNPNNRGFAAAVNQGISMATGEYVLLLNPDATLLPDALARLVEFLEAHPCTAAAGPRQWLDEGCTWQWSTVPWPPHWWLILSGLPGLWRLGLARRQLAAHWALNRAIWRDERPRDASYLSGACLLLRRSALEAVGRLDEGYFLFFEDVDLCDKLRAAGWALYAVPSAGAVHTLQGSVRCALNKEQRYLLSSGCRYLTRRGDLLTRALWTLLQSRRARRASSMEQPNLSGPMALTLRWPSTAGAVAYWVELSPDPTFLYVAATQVSRPACTLPERTPMVTQGKKLFWRAAAVNSQGQLGPFTSIRHERIYGLPSNQRA